MYSNKNVWITIKLNYFMKIVATVRISSLTRLEFQYNINIK